MPGVLLIDRDDAEQVALDAMRPISHLALILALASSLAAQSSLLDRGRAALDRNDPDTAATLLEQAVDQTPQNANAHYFLGVAYGKQAEKASVFRAPSLARKTRAEFERAVQLDPNHLDARYALVQYYMEAPSFLGGGDEKARDQAAEIAKRNAACGHRSLAFIYLKKKDYKAAMTEVNAALAIDANDEDALDLLKQIRERSSK